MESFFGKKYKLSTSEKFDEYMKAVGVGMLTRKVGATVSPVVEINKDGDKYVLTSNSTFKNVKTEFTPGVEIDDTTPDGRKVKSTFTIDGNTISEKQVSPDGKVSTIDRTWTDDEIKMILKVDDIVCTRVYKVQA